MTPPVSHGYFQPTKAGPFLKLKSWKVSPLYFPVTCFWLTGMPVSMVRNEVSFHYKRLYVVQSLPGRICSRLGSIVSSAPEFTQVLPGPRNSYTLYSSTDYYPSEFKPSILNYDLRGKNRLIWDNNSPSLPFFLLLASNILLRDFHSVEYFQNSLL